MTIVPAVIGLIFQQNQRFLLIKRQNHPFKGLWALPGGHIEYGEHISRVAIREVKEETGILTKFIKLWGIMSELIIQQEQLSRHHLIHICLLHPLYQETLPLNSKYIKWFIGAPNPHSPWLIPSDALVIREALHCNQGGYYNCTLNVDRNKIGIVEFERINTI